MSLLGAITPLVKAARNRSLWLQCVLASTVAGCVSATLMGGALGMAGRWLGVEEHGESALYLVAFVALLLTAREWGWVRFPLPERKAQTEKVWAHEFGFVMASAMWGFHIGLGFATRITYGGFWALVVVALALGNPAYGAVLMTVYWLGRSLPLWVAPMLWAGRDSSEFFEEAASVRPVYSRLVGLGLFWSTGIILFCAVTTQESGPLKFLARHFMMRDLFVLSYALLCALVVIEAVLLREVLRRAAWLKRFYADSPRGNRMGLTGGSRAPDFLARVLGTDRVLTTSDLEAHETILMFLSTAESSSPLYRHLKAAIHALWHDVEGWLYIVCRGSEDACRQLAHDVCPAGHEVPVLLDEGGQMARSFFVDATPKALRFDEDIRLTRYGYPLASDEQEKEEPDAVTDDTDKEEVPAVAEQRIVGTAFAGPLIGQDSCNGTGEKHDG